MLGEELAQIAVTETGLFGDRAYALVDDESGKIISAKNPRKWGDLFAFRAALPKRDRRGWNAPGRSDHVPRRVERRLG